MNLKEAMQRDIEAVFFNDTEFAEAVNVNGTDMLVVPDTEGIKQMSDEKKMANAEIAFRVKASFFEHMPQPEKLMKYDGETYEILVCNNEMGVLNIVLGRRRA